MSKGEIRRVHHVAVRTADFEGVAEYYVATLGFRSKWRWGTSPERFAMLELGPGDHVEIVEALDTSGSARPTIDHFCFSTPDCRTAIEDLRLAGTKILSEPTTFTVDMDVGAITVTIAWFEGPAGERLELLELH